MILKRNAIIHMLLLMAILMCFACSSGDERIEEIFEIIEKKDSILGDSINEGQTSPTQSVFTMEPYFPLTKGGGSLQGAALYGDYLFHATSGSTIHIYNMKEKRNIATMKLGTMGHADTICFGIQKVEENDEFPVLYISGSQSNTLGKGGDIYVYRIIHSTDETDNENWQGSLIQHIVTPDVAVVGSFPDVVIDVDNSVMWMMGWLTSYEYDKESGGGCTNCFSKFKLPDIREGKQDNKGVYQLTLTEEDRLSYFLVYDIHAITQGLCYFNGKIICPYGMPSVTYKGIDIVDVEKERVVYNVNLKGSKIAEAEAAVVYENNLFLLGQGDYVYICTGLDL